MESIYNQLIVQTAMGYRQNFQYFLADLKNQPIRSLCVTHILQFCGYFKGQEQICFNPTSWNLVTYNLL